MSFSIRTATERDCDELCVISDQVNKLIRDNLPEHSKEVPVWVTDGDAFLKSFSAKNEVIFVAEENGKVIGFVTASVETEPDDLISVPYMMVDRLAVTEACKRRGIGKSLMERVHEWARQKGIGVMRLAVWAFNKEAVTFYNMLGYATVESIMEKTLEKEAR